MDVFYSDPYEIPLPAGHRFPSGKYRLLRDLLSREGIVQPGELHLSPVVSRADLLRAHEAAYVDAMEAGQMDLSAMRRIGLPWSPELVTRVKATTGGTLAAARSALRDSVAGQLAGGTHHAHRDFGSGYCVFNDFAVAALTMLDEGLVSRVAIIDLDVHQGDGNASILKDEFRVFVCSVHGAKNFPFRKHESDLDIELPDGTDDENYLHAVASAIEQVFAFQPDLVLYQAGVDPLKEDRLGRLDLTHEGLKARDGLVLEGCAKRGIPVCLALGGGYADPIEASVAAYANTYRVAKGIFRI